MLLKCSYPVTGGLLPVPASPCWISIPLRAHWEVVDDGSGTLASHRRLGLSSGTRASVWTYWTGQAWSCNLTSWCPPCCHSQCWLMHTEACAVMSHWSTVIMEQTQVLRQTLTISDSSILVEHSSVSEDWGGVPLGGSCDPALHFQRYL